VDLFLAHSPDEPAPALGTPITDAYEDPREVSIWPCRLWRVADGEVVEELPAWRVFGVLGEAVLTVVERAGAITEEQVAALAALDDREEGRLYQAAWLRWGRTGERVNPVGSGVSEARRAVEEAARRTDDGLFGWDDYDEVEVLTDRVWRRAGHAAMAAALASGAPWLFEPEEREVVTHGWRTVMGA